MAVSGFYESDKAQKILEIYQKKQQALEVAMENWENIQEEHDNL